MAEQLTPDLIENTPDITPADVQPSAAENDGDDDRLFSEWPTCPSEAFYGVIGELAQTVAPYTEADPVAVLVQGLLIAGAIIGDSAHFEVGATRHPPREFTVIVGRTGAGRKGTGLDVARWAMTPPPKLGDHGNSIDPDWTFPPIIKGCGSGEGLIWAVRDPISRTEPIRGTGTKGNRGPVTGYEDIVVDKGVTDKRVILEETEFAGLLHIANRERNTLSMILRQLWETGDLQNTVKNSPLRATGAHGIVIGHITPEELRTCLPSIEISNGFANRFLWICSRKVKNLPDGDELSKVDLHPFKKRLGKVFRDVKDQTTTSSRMTRNPEARAIWQTVYPLLSDGRSGLLGALFGRAVAHVLRLSCLYALLDGTLTIQAEHLIAALGLWEYVESSAVYLFGEDTSGNPDEDKLLDALKEAGDTGLSRTEISVKVFQKHKIAQEIALLVQALSEKEQIKFTEETTNGRKRQRVKYAACELSELSELRQKRHYRELAQQALTRFREDTLNSQEAANKVRIKVSEEGITTPSTLALPLNSHFVRTGAESTSPVSMRALDLNSLNSLNSHQEALPPPPPYSRTPYGRPFAKSQEVWLYRTDGQPLLTTPTAILQIRSHDGQVDLLWRPSSDEPPRWHNAVYAMPVQVAL